SASADCRSSYPQQPEEPHAYSNDTCIRRWSPPLSTGKTTVAQVISVIQEVVSLGVVSRCNDALQGLQQQ
ncbi:MAG: hypothetical protein ACRD1G_08590, partial [Acidimicrobiales bacterium]